MTLIPLPDHDPLRASQAFQSLYRKLISYFSHWRCPDPENLAAETISRAERSIKEGKTLEGEDAVGKFVFTIAKNVRLEDYRERQKQGALFGVMQTSSQTASQPNNLRAQCLHRCLQELPAKDRALIIVYEGLDAEQRKALAEHLGIAESTLRARVTRIRHKLRECARNC